MWCRRWPIVLIACAGCGFSVPATPTDGGTQSGDTPGDPPMAAWLDGWAYRRPITMHASQIEAPNDGELRNFPVMLALPDALVAAHALADRSDLAFTTNDATTRLDHELEVDDTTTMTVWVKIPSLPATTDTTIFLYYGNPTPPPPLAPADVWTESFHAVYHLQQDPGPGLPDQILDATANGHHGTADSSMSTPDLVAGQVGRAMDFNGSNACITLPAFDVGNAFTLSVWLNLNNVSQIRTLLSNSQDGSSTNGFRWFVNSNGSSDRKLALETGNGGSTNQAITPGAAITTSAWHHAAAIVDRINGMATLMVDGMVVNASDTSIRNDFSTNHYFEIGRMQTNNAFDGMLDEVEISSDVRSVEWIRTSFRNQGAPQDFTSVGQEQMLGP